MPSTSSEAYKTRVNNESIQGTVYHTDTTAKWFLVSAVSYFFIVGIIALTIAAKFCIT